MAQRDGRPSLQRYLSQQDDPSVIARIARQSHLPGFAGSGSGTLCGTDRQRDSYSTSGMPSVPISVPTLTMGATVVSPSFSTRTRASRPDLPESGTNTLVQVTLDCPFLFTGCDRQFSNFPNWLSHSLAHFENVPPPSRNFCNFCEEMFEAQDGLQSWMEKLDHTYHHHVWGHRLAQGRPDAALYCYLWETGLLTRELWKQLMPHLEAQSARVDSGSLLSPTTTGSWAVVVTPNSKRNRRREQTERVGYAIN